MDKAKIGLVGLGVMGQNLVLNMERNGFPVAVYNRTAEKTKDFVEGPAKGKNIIPVFSYSELMQVLEKPRRILLMVKAGAPVDLVIDQIKPFLEQGDILIDGGNSLFSDTERRNTALEGEGFRFIGTGVSGGEEGALWGPSIMPGGQIEAWEALEPILKSIAAKTEDGTPCVAYIGPKGAGHFVKMVHNGIEYADMQLIAETYDLMQRGLGLKADELAEIFTKWNNGRLHSYLIEISAQIFRKIDPETGEALVDLVLDEAQQKGTGKWTSQTAFDLGAPTNTINAAVVSRIISALKTERLAASKELYGPKETYTGSPEVFVEKLEEALYTAKVISYAQGFGLMQIASDEFNYALDMKTIASIWRAGCIIRADLLDDIMAAYERNTALQNLMLDEAFKAVVLKGQAALREVITTGVKLGIPVYALAACLSYFDAYRSERLPANLTQAQRDFFGAHTYRRVDKEGIFHTEWAD